jgi:hypothetical protein
VFQNQTDGFRNPSWRDQIRRGVNATTTFSGQFASASSSWFTASEDFTWLTQDGRTWQVNKGETFGRLIYSVDPSSFPTAPSDVVTRVTNRCIQDFLSSCESARSTIEGGQDLGEYKEILESIHNPLGSMRDKLLHYLTQLTKAKRSFKRDPKSLVRVLSDTYLELRFGIEPLVSDVAAAIADAGRYRFSVVPVHGKAHEVYEGSAVQVSQSIGYLNNLNPTQIRQSHSTYSVRYKGAIRSGADASGQIGIAQAYRLLPRDWVPTAWDLLPWSWVADYFTNIGDIINALCFVSSDLVWGSTGWKDSSSVSYSDISITKVPVPAFLVLGSDNSYAYGGSAKFTRSSFGRAAMTTADLLPRFTLRVPVTKYPYFNLAAVLSQRAGGLVPFFK